jgi:FAD/FMN-containing dehydrogenase/Fe-S oxidoreductase
MRSRIDLPSRLDTATSRPRSDRSGIESLNVRRLEKDLRRVVRGEVRFDEGTRALYATDGSNYRQPPIGAVIPVDAEDVVNTVEVCRAHDAPIVSRGGGTSLAGQTCNVAVLMDFSKYMNRILDLDQGERRARVQPGVVLDDLRDAAERYHLTFAPDPSTHEYCTLGGMIGNNSCGVHSVMGGLTADNVEELEILTFDGLRMRVGPTPEPDLASIIAQGERRGEIYAALRDLIDRYGDEVRERYPNIPRRVSGYNLDRLLPENGFDVAKALVGTESTCVTVLEATVRLVYSPPARSLLVLAYEDVYAAADHVMEVLETGPIGLEGIDQKLVQDIQSKHMKTEKDLALLPDGRGFLLVEYGGQTKDEADGKAKQLMSKLKKAKDAPSMKLFDDALEEKRVWEIRESGLGATARLPNQPDTWEGWEDSAAPPERFGDYLRDLRKLFDRYGYDGAFYGHFGQGCLHTRINFDVEKAEGIAKYRSFIEEACDLVVSHGGSLSGEHGDGQSRAEMLPKMFGDDLVKAFGEFKGIWDPRGKMNPGKVVDPYRIDENMRFGTGYRPPRPNTHFAYSDDDGSFARATARCVGVGKCRKHDAGTMCPSYMVTKEERHSTRGRAHLLFEMLQGDPLRKGWRSDRVHEALDLCLACKACKSECPINVDMATYKAEFLSHYYKGRLRPRTGYAMGLIYWWARLASLAPRIVNAAASSRTISGVLKRMGGIHPDREIPKFATESFRAWFRRRGERNRSGPPVLLWPDTFNNYLHPWSAQATVEVLEAAGYRVIIPDRVLCCGRPLYDFGMLDTAKRLLHQVLEGLRPHIAAGMPVVGVEPSCLAVFRDELVEMFPGDLDAERLSKQSYTLSEFLEKYAGNWEIPKLERKAIVQHHCHHNAVMGFDAEEKVLDRLGLDYEVLDSGCCGMAGSFGFEKDKYDVSQACGERVLLPAVRRADEGKLVIADGFSCQEQIEQSTDRKGLHLAQVIQMALREGPKGPQEAPPETSYTELRADGARGIPRKTLVKLAGVSALAVGAFAWRHRQGVRALTIRRR